MAKNNKANKIEAVESDELKSNKTKVDKQDKLDSEAQRYFDDVLDSDEKIIKTFKPSKTKSYLANILKLFLPFLGIVIVSVLFFIDPESDIVLKEVLSTVGYISIIFVALEIGLIALTSIYIRNTYYVYTNKRVIIRTGIFGVDYKSLDIDKIGAVDVYVSLIDKIVRNTGTIRFGSASSPINGQTTSYMFAHIKEPYKVCKEIKNYMEEIKKNKKA